MYTPPLNKKTPLIIKKKLGKEICLLSIQTEA